MKSNSPNQSQSTFLYQGLKEILNPKEPLYQFSDKMPWGEIEKQFEKYYVNFGRPTKAIRLMVSLQNPLNNLIIYDIIGEEVATLINEQKPGENYTVKFDASNLSSCIYFYRITFGNFMATKKLILLK